MNGDQELLKKLKEMLHLKKSKQYYAERLHLTEREVNSLIREIKDKEKYGTYDYVGEVEKLQNSIIKEDEDIKKGTKEITVNVLNEIKSLDELIEKCKIDVKKWEIERYIQNYWGNDNTPHWQVKAWLKKKEDEQLFQDAFIEFLKDYSPCTKQFKAPINLPKPYASLVLNKQDAHFNKFDVNGDNDLNKRFSSTKEKTKVILHQARLSNNLDNIIYIVGSDEFNSEWMNTTTKGTPQTNIFTHYEAFEKICSYEVEMIEMLLEYSGNVDVVYVSGNHDEWAGWYLIKWIESYFRNEKRLTFDVSPSYRKYVSYGNTAMMFNHGDVLRAPKLASIFPIEFRENWSEHEHFLCFTGDRHHEVTLDMNGIMFYQLPSLSSANSSWDEKHGHVTAKGEITGFLIDEIEGVTNIFKQYL